MKAASAYVPNGLAFENPRFISDRIPLEIGPFPDHALPRRPQRVRCLCLSRRGRAADGSFYSGDFRAHGRKGKLFEAMIERPPKDIDILLMEGTTIGRTGTDEGFPTEADLEKEFVRAFRETEGIHLVWASAQNIDRMVTIFRAAKRTGRVLVIDLYTAVVLEATEGTRSRNRSGTRCGSTPRIASACKSRKTHCLETWTGTRPTVFFRKTY